VELERVRGRDPRGALGLRGDDQLAEQLGAAIEGATEALLLVAHPAQHRVTLGGELGVGGREQLERAVGELLHVRRLEPDRAPLLDRAPHDSPQHVAALFVGGHDPVGDQRRGPARVVAEDPHRARDLAALGVGAARELLGEVDQRPQRVGLEDRVEAVEDDRHPLDPHAGVDVLHRQLGQRAILGEVVGHEDVVPELDEAVAVVAGAVVGAAELDSAVEVELRAGPTRAGRTGLPEVLRARQLDDPLVGDPRLAPDLDRLFVGAETELLVTGEDRDPNPLGVEAVALNRKLPAPRDRLGLEVVAEAPVAEHLEEGQVALCVADLLDVGGAEAALDVGEPRRRRLLAAEEVGLERLHPGSRQQHRGVVDRGHERGRGHA
jgi:hypothetical protein